MLLCVLMIISGLLLLLAHTTCHSHRLPMKDCTRLHGYLRRLCSSPRRSWMGMYPAKWRLFLAMLLGAKVHSCNAAASASSFSFSHCRAEMKCLYIPSLLLLLQGGLLAARSVTAGSAALLAKHCKCSSLLWRLDLYMIRRHGLMCFFVFLFLLMWLPSLHFLY